MGKLIHEELSRSIIGAAMEALNELKPGPDEKLYERAMAIELRRAGHTVAPQNSYPVFYRGEMIGNLTPDMIVDERVIVDGKVVSTFTDAHVAQMIGTKAGATAQLQACQALMETGRRSRNRGQLT